MSCAPIEGKDIALVGLLRFEFEGTALDHFPKSERRDAEDVGPLEPSSLWLSAGSGALQFNEEQLRQWYGQRVTVLGTLLGPDEKLGGGGHFSAFLGISRRDTGSLHRAALAGQNRTFACAAEFRQEQTLLTFG